MHGCVSIYIYIYIYRERERENLVKELYRDYRNILKLINTRQ